MILPGMPGHFGTFEGSVVYALSFFNLYGLNNIEDNFGFGFILHFVSYIPYTIFGLFYFIEEYKFFITIVFVYNNKFKRESVRAIKRAFKSRLEF